MGPSRHTFVVKVWMPDGPIQVEDARTRQRTRVATLAEVGDQIAQWLAERPLRRAEDADQTPLPKEIA